VYILPQYPYDDKAACRRRSDRLRLQCGFIASPSIAVEHASECSSGAGGSHVLKNLSPLLNADLLHALASMGHGDELAIVDAHFPAASMARRLVRVDGVSAPEVLAACLSLMPLDTFVESPANRMELVHAPDEVPEVAHDFQRAIDEAEARHLPLGKIDRHAFYKRAQQAYAIVATGERRTYGCILITKGVVL